MSHTKPLHFLKSHASGNDYIIIIDPTSRQQQPEEATPESSLSSPQIPYQSQVSISQQFLQIPRPDFVSLVQKLSERRFSIGADGLLILDPSRISMNMYNPDGSEAEMCGNGLRCAALFFAKYFPEHACKSHGQDQHSCHIAVQTKAGIKNCIVQTQNNEVECSMGEPKLPTDLIKHSKVNQDKFILGEFLLEGVLKNAPAGISPPKVAYCVSMGNPHAVILVDNVDQVPIEEWGPVIEMHSTFKNRTNVEFVSIQDADAGIVHQRTWERGAGETLSCGTGGAAVATVCVALGAIRGQEAHIHMRGGLVHYKCVVSSSSEGHDTAVKSTPIGISEVKLRGTAHIVYSGQIALV